MSVSVYSEDVAYDSFDDISIIASYVSRTLEKRKELTENLIKKDKFAFKKFIKVVVMHFIKLGSITEPIDELLRINTDKFLEEGLIEYLDYDLFPLDGNNESKKLKIKNYSSLSVKSSK